MSYYKGTYQQCEEYNNDCVIAHNHIDSTSSWAKIIFHPNGVDFAIQKSTNVSSSMTLINELTPDWFQ